MHPSLPPTPSTITTTTSVRCVALLHPYTHTHPPSSPPLPPPPLSGVWQCCRGARGRLTFLFPLHDVATGKDNGAYCCAYRIIVLLQFGSVFRGRAARTSWKRRRLGYSCDFGGRSQQVIRGVDQIACCDFTGEFRFQPGFQLCVCLQLVFDSSWSDLVFDQCMVTYGCGVLVDRVSEVASQAEKQVNNIVCLINYS